MHCEWIRIVKEYREARKGFATRRDFLIFLASGPDNRDDVQAARRLLQKQRYK